MFNCCTLYLMTTTNSTGMLTHSQIVHGVDLPLSELSDWQRSADGWTIRLCSTISADYFGPGNWPEFHYWKGSAHNGEPPTVADLIYSVAMDSSMLESEPEQINYPTGKAIEHNENKMRKLFGCAYWERIKEFSEEEIEEAFGAFS